MGLEVKQFVNPSRICIIAWYKGYVQTDNKFKVTKKKHYIYCLFKAFQPSKYLTKIWFTNHCKVGASHQE